MWAWVIASLLATRRQFWPETVRRRYFGVSPRHAAVDESVPSTTRAVREIESLFKAAATQLGAAVRSGRDIAAIIIERF